MKTKLILIAMAACAVIVSTVPRAHAQTPTPSPTPTAMVPLTLAGSPSAPVLVRTTPVLLTSDQATALLGAILATQVSGQPVIGLPSGITAQELPSMVNNITLQRVLVGAHAGQFVLSAALAIPTPTPAP